MDDEKLSPCVQYHPSDASILLVQGGSAPLQTPSNRARKCSCTAMGWLKVAVTVFMITTVAALSLFFLQRSESTPNAEHLETSALPDVTNFTLVAADNHYITMAWDQPPRGIDFYMLDVTARSGYENARLRKQRPGTCSNGTFIQAEQTQVTCGPFDACSNLSVTIRTYKTGPPGRTSMGATLKEIFISAQDPSEPRSITMVAKSPSMTRLLWEPPTRIHGLVDVYKVEVCEMFSECDQKQNLSDCVEHEASDTWLDFDSTEDTSYCVLITASARCGGRVLTSLPAMQEVTTPLFSLPAVSNLKLAGVKSGLITLSWERPKGRFDYYSVEVTEDKVSSTHTAKHRLGLCANGTIIRPDQTELTCGPLEPCSNLSCTMRTHLSGPPERSSPGVTVTGIFIPAEDPNPPTNLTMFPESPSRTRIHWDRPEKVSAIMVSYTVKICSTFRSCVLSESMRNCTEYVTTEMWTEFDSTVDTPYCVLVTVKTRCGVDEVTSRPLLAEIRTPIFDLPDATNLRLLSALDNSITVAWERPQARFDYYWVSIAHDEDRGHGNAQREHVGSCSNGTIVHPNVTRVTCPNLEACSKVSITLRVHRNGPPEHTSRGVTLHGIFIPGEDPDPPQNVTMFGKSPSLTRLQWEASAKVYGRFLGYTVKICDTFKSCGVEANMRGCIEIQAHETWLDFHSSVDTNYCVLVKTSSQCGEQVLNGRPAAAEIRTPLLVLPDVTNLTLSAADNHYITVAWDPPRGSFDFYWIDVATENDNDKDSLQKHHAGSCGNGTIIRAEQTQVTCGPFDPCCNISVTVRTFVKGPPARTSMGTTLKGVFLKGQDPSEPKTIAIVAKSSTMTRLQWEPPTSVHGILEIYKVKVCKEFTMCDQNASAGGCIEHSASDTWLDFESIADTSYCALITATARCGVDILTSPPAMLEVRTPLFDLPDVRKLSILSAANNSITIAWERPKTRFDYYWVYVTSDESKKSGSLQENRLGSCSNRTIIHSAETRVTCTNLEACTKVSISVRTHRSGLPEHTSQGVGLEDIFIAGEDLDPPKNLIMVGKSPSLTRLQWEPSAKISGRFLGYMAKICDSFKSCGREANMSNCVKLQTYETWLDFNSSVDTNYCVVVTTSSQCGEQVLYGPPVVAEIRTPLLVAPDVTKIRLVTVGTNFFTAAWEKPKGRFDYYLVEVTGGDDHTGGDDRTSGAQTAMAGSCANGTIIHPDQTQVTCSQIKPCSKVRFKVRTHIIGPPSRTSPGVTLSEIFLTERVLPEVTNLKLGAIRRDNFVLTWQPLKACFDYYTVEIIDETDGDNISVSCNKGAVINANETFVICDQTVTCANVTIRVRTHSIGPPRRSSTGANLTHVLMKGKDPPNVTNLKLGTIGPDNFVLTWQTAKTCFDYQSVYITQKTSGGHSGMSCKKSDVSKGVVTCHQTETCTNVTFRVTTHTIDRRSSVSATLTHVLMQGEVLPKVVNLKLADRSQDSYFIIFKAPKKCFDIFPYNITYREVGKQERCYQGDPNTFPIARKTFMVTCTQGDTCGFLESVFENPFKNLGGLLHRGILIRGKCKA